jgi:hypothetical protein
MMTNNRVLAETALYVIKTEVVKSTLTLTGIDEVYVIINKDTHVVEGRAGCLPDALGHMNGLQLAYDNITRQTQQLASAEPPPTERPN